MVTVVVWSTTVAHITYIHIMYTVNLEIFIVKFFSYSMAATKINLTKLVRTINANVVRGRSYEIFLHETLSYESFFTRKFPDLRYYTHI